MKKRPVRLIAVLLCFVGLYAIVLLRLFYFQVVVAGTFDDLGRSQSNETLEVDSGRGDIVTSDNFPIATNKTLYLLYANPKVIKDRQEYVDKLSPILEMEDSTISARLKKDLFWIKLKDNVSDSLKSKIEKLKLEGLGFQKQSIRYYPEASMAAHMVGFVGRDDTGEAQGYFGLEGYYNEQLKGRAGRLYVVKDALGNPILTDIRTEEKIEGRKLILGIDRAVQYFAEKRLGDGVRKYEAEGGTVIIMESKTGKILGMVSYPQFDPQNYYEFEPKTYKNPAISDVYEPGSTFKVLVMAAAIDKGLVKPDTRCWECGGPVSIGGYTIKTWNDKYYDNTTMTDVIKHSDNTGMVFIAKKLGLDGIIEYFDKLGIGEATGIDLQGEVSGDVRPRDEWYVIDLATASFGQGISITPLGLITAVNTIASGGDLLQPYVVSQIVAENKTIEIKPKVVRKVFSSATTKVMTWMMVNAIENGESKWVKIPNYEIAGKTGTAQIPVAGHYDPNQTNASFVGFFPAKDPQITMLVVVNKPKTRIYGSETAAPIFFQIARDLIGYYNIPPDI